jgi:hypothetical protein
LERAVGDQGHSRCLEATDIFSASSTANPEIPMAKTPQKSKSPADDLAKPVSRQLEQRELEEVHGGKVTMSDFHFVKKSDKASPQ